MRALISSYLTFACQFFTHAHYTTLTHDIFPNKDYIIQCNASHLTNDMHGAVFLFTLVASVGTHLASLAYTHGSTYFLQTAVIDVSNEH